MKLVREFIVDDGRDTIRIRVEFDRKSHYDINDIKNRFENIVDDIVSKVLLERYHSCDIRRIKP